MAITVWGAIAFTFTEDYIEYSTEFVDKTTKLVFIVCRRFYN
ncbi:MAG: hypothetical protein V7K89_03835 [Nostoc sp.]